VSYPNEVTTVLVVAVAIVVVDLVLRLVFRHRLPAGGHRPVGPFRWLRVAVNVAGVVALFLVASTAMSRLMTNENGLTGDRLIWHVSMAPVFAVAAVAVAFLWAYRNRFSSKDWGHGWALPLRKIFFWLSVMLAIPTFGTIIAAMYPLTDTEGQESLIQIHRYCGPLLAGTGFLFAYFALVSWREWRQD
jgi:hypothetical protein